MVSTHTPTLPRSVSKGTETKVLKMEPLERDSQMCASRAATTTGDLALNFKGLADAAMESKPEEETVTERTRRHKFKQLNDENATPKHDESSCKLPAARETAVLSIA